MSAPPLNPALFHLDENHLWVMHCAEGPIPRAALRAIRAFLPKELQPWREGWESDFLGIPAALRAACARLVAGRPEDISLTATTSSGLVTVAQGLAWTAGDEVLAPLGEFPANAWPWLALRPRGVRYRTVPLWEGHRAGSEAWASTPPREGVDPEARLLAALAPETRVLATSWVRFQDGLRLDLLRLAQGCAERGVRLVVDGIQGAGTVPARCEGLAAFACSAHKGLLSPQGIAFLWTEAGFRRTLAPTGSWLSVEEATDFARPSTDLDRAWLRDGRALEAGGPNLLHGTAMLEALDLLDGTGIPRIQAHVAQLQRGLLAALKGTAWGEEARRLGGLLEAGRLGSILAFHHGNRGPDGLARLLQAGFRRGIFASVREGYLRIAFHGFHAEADVERVAAWLSGTAS